MSHKLGVCIPYRNREEHLNQLLPKLDKHLGRQGIEYQVYVAHQVDDKLFNRGAMKNIAAKHALDDGCDYIAWHDVDMIPYDETCDYSYPEETPIHIATKLSKYSYSMGYEQYFGGVVLFNKEHIEKTNGYSNEYWDWGQEDDDLFYRCHFEGYSNVDTYETIENERVYNFDGKTSYLSFKSDRSITTPLFRNHTVSVLVSPDQQPELVPIWLVGDEKREFIEYPILRKEGSWTWGLSFNNSRALSTLHFDQQNNPIYHWAKCTEKNWAWFTISYDHDEQLLYIFMNDKLVSNNGDILRSKPIILPSKFKSHGSVGDFFVGRCTHTGNYFKGKVADLKIYDRSFTTFEECRDNKENLIYDLKKDSELTEVNVEYSDENIEITKSILPHRREGSFYCLPHLDEGLVNGKWAKGETTAKNERRFITEMQQGKINYKEDGINSLKYELVETIQHTEKCKILNVKL